VLSDTDALVSLIESQEGKFAVDRDQDADESRSRNKIGERG